MVESVKGKLDDRQVEKKIKIHIIVQNHKIVKLVCFEYK